MLSKSLIQFSVDRQSCVPFLLFNLRPNCDGVMNIMAISFKRSCAGTAALSAPYPAAGHHHPKPLPETHGHSQASLPQSPVGSLLLFLGPGTHKVLLVPSKGRFPQSQVRSVIKSHCPPK